MAAEVEAEAADADVRVGKPPVITFTLDARRQFQEASAVGEQRANKNKAAAASASSRSLASPRSLTSSRSLSAPVGDVPLREDPKFSTMTKKERDRQFTCYFREQANDCLAVKARIAKEQRDERERGYRLWQPYEPRADIPQRHGKFGRRAFDPQVRERPVVNPHGISEIENKPMEDFFRQQERVHDFLDRSFPPQQRSHFKTYLPTCEAPGKHVELASRAPVNSIMDGGQKKTNLGYGQFRHSDPTDMTLSFRPLGASQIDRLRSLAGPGYLPP